MATTSEASSGPPDTTGGDRFGPNYKWIALSNTTLGVLLATINQSIVLIALPNIFDGIHLNPLEPGNTSYLLWMLMGFLVVSAVLVVSFGRLGDMYGRVKMYRMGFAVFTVASILLSVCWMSGTTAALWLIGWRVIQGIGGAFVFANSTAILTDVFPARQRGMALGINTIAAISGSFLGLLLGGLVAPANWHLVFLISVPIGVFGTIWAYLKLRDTGIRTRARIDWWGNLTFALGLIAILVAITYGIQPYGTSAMGWGNPLVITGLAGGSLLLVAFCFIETRVAEPLIQMSLFRIRAFSAGNVANLMTALGRGGLQFTLIIWLQGIWLPQHGYSFEQTPLWAGIYMLPMTAGLLIAAPVSGFLSDRMGQRSFTVGGAVIAALSFLLLVFLPVNFSYLIFALLVALNGLGMGLFSAPNRAEIMNSVPANQRGAGAGITATVMNTAMVLSIGIFFSLLVAGLSSSLPSTLYSGLTAQGVATGTAHTLSQLPPIGVLFASFLGYNPIQQLLGPSALNHLPAGHASYLTGRSFFPQLITQPFHDGLTIVFWFSIAACVIAAIASLLTGPRSPVETVTRLTAARPVESVGSRMAAVAGEEFGVVSELVIPDGVGSDTTGRERSP